VNPRRHPCTAKRPALERNINEREEIDEMREEEMKKRTRAGRDEEENTGRKR
jgi:hypothetical protein